MFSTELRAPHGTLLEHSNPRLGNDLGQEGATFYFKSGFRFPGGLGVELVSKPRRSGVRVCRIVQGHGIPRSPQGAATATSRREGAGGPLLREEPSIHQISQKDWKPFHRTTAKWSIGSSSTSQSQSRFSIVDPFPGNGRNAPSVLMLPSAHDSDKEQPYSM